jgi:hypothetical protein
MSDLGEMRLSDVYRGLGSSSGTVNEETLLDDRDKNSMGLASEKYVENVNGNPVTKIPDNTDKRKLMLGIGAFVGFIILVGALS